MSDDFELRWDRFGKTPTELEQKPHLEKAKMARIKEERNDRGLY